MTLESTVTKKSYDGDDSTVSFPTTFIFWDNTDIEVILKVDATGVESTWVEGTQYTLSGGSGSNGTVTVETSPTDYTPATGETLLIRSARDDKQSSDLPLGGAFPATETEQALDQATRLIQQSSEKIDRSIKLPKATTLSEIILPEPESGKVLKWKSTEDEFENSDYDPDSQQAAAAASASAASTSETNASTSETNASTSETNAAASEAAAAASAAGVNLPSVSPGDDNKILQVNDTEDGYELTGTLTGQLSFSGAVSSTIVSATNSSSGYPVISGTCTNSGSSANNIGVKGHTSGTAGKGVDAQATSVTGVTYGVYGRAASSAGYGVYSDGNFKCTGDAIIATKTPSGAGDTGVAGTIAWDSSYFYVCVATDTWTRVALAW